MINIGKTIYLLTDGTYVHCDSDTITFELSSGEKQRFACNVISEIIIFYNTTLSTYIMSFCAKHDIIIHYISHYGSYIGCFLGKYSGNVVLRDKQFCMQHDDIKKVNYVRNVVCAKLQNSAWLLSYFGHHNINHDVIVDIRRKLNDNIVCLRSLDNIDDIRILEANSAAIYFSTFDLLIKSNDSSMAFIARSRRPPLNNANALLSLFYTLCTSICDSALMCRGLDSECGYLHTLRSGRKSLACDLVEEFRACVVDRFVLTVINRKEVVADDFVHNNDGIYLSVEGKRKLFSKWEQYLNNMMVTHLLYGKQLSYRCLFYEQAQLLAQYIRGDIDVYPAFIMR